MTAESPPFIICPRPRRPRGGFLDRGALCTSAETSPSPSCATTDAHVAGDSLPAPTSRPPDSLADLSDRCDAPRRAQILRDREGTLAQTHPGKYVFYLSASLL